MNPVGNSPFIPNQSSAPHSSPHSGPIPKANTAPPVNHQPINIDNLLALKLNNPNLKLNFEESIALMTECIKRGDVEAAHAKNKDLVVLIGNTGSGKSTFGNYASGCTMKKVHPKTLNITGLENVVVVKPSSEGGSLDEIMPIGHSKKSMTFMPQITRSTKGFSFCDCPGFLDNRGIEINIANAVNIKKAFGQANGVKVVILINYHSLQADRSRGLFDMIKICSDLFGSKENLIKYQESILLGITGIPQAVHMNGTSSLTDLKEWIAKTGLQDHFSEQALICLAERVFIYDPLDDLNLQFDGAWNKSTILQNIENLLPIANPKEIFKTILTDEDKLGLVEISIQIEKQMHDIFSQKKLTENDFKQAAVYHESLCQLEAIEHPQVIKLISNARNTIGSHFKNMIHSFERHCLSNATALSNEAETILTQLKNGIQHFDQEIQSKISIAELEKQLDLYKKKIEAKELARELRDMERDFRDHCSTTNFKSAEILADLMLTKIRLLDTDYKETKVNSEVKIDLLNTLLGSSKEAHRKRLSEERKQNEKIADLQKKQIEMQEKQNRIDKERREQEAQAAAREQELRRAREQEEHRKHQERALSQVHYAASSAALFKDFFNS